LENTPNNFPALRIEDIRQKTDGEIIIVKTAMAYCQALHVSQRSINFICGTLRHQTRATAQTLIIRLPTSRRWSASEYRSAKLFPLDGLSARWGEGTKDRFLVNKKAPVACLSLTHYAIY
jgi:hypothetical protein